MQNVGITSVFGQILHPHSPKKNLYTLSLAIHLLLTPPPNHACGVPNFHTHLLKLSCINKGCHLTKLQLLPLGE